MNPMPEYEDVRDDELLLDGSAEEESDEDYIAGLLRTTLPPEARDLLDSRPHNAQVAQAAQVAVDPPPPHSMNRAIRRRRVSRRTEEDTLREGALLLRRYRVERVLGKSRIAVNVRVRHAELRQRFLVLYVHEGALARLEAVARFRNGARLALQLRGTHVARTIDAGRFESNVPYVVIEFPSGSTLKQAIATSGPLSITDAADFALQACLGLSEAHRLGLVHGALGTSRLLLDRGPDGSSMIKVLGFGVAEALCPLELDDERALSDGDPTGDSGESEVCLAPEQIRSPGDVDGRVDIWGLGATLHEMLTGAPVFEAAGGSALVAMIAADPPVPVTAYRPDVPAGLEAVILRCLSKDPNARYATVAEFAQAIAPFASHDAQRDVDSIVRTLARTTRPPALPGSTTALVRIGVPRSAPPPAPTPAPAPPPAPARTSVSKASMALLGIGGALALAGAAMLGAGVATRFTASTAAAPSFDAPRPLPPLTNLVPETAAATAGAVAPTEPLAVQPPKVSPKRHTPVDESAKSSPNPPAPTTVAAHADNAAANDSKTTSSRDLFDDTR